MDWIGWVIFGLAVLGAALGVLNTWHSLDQRRVSLRVRPALAIPTPVPGRREAADPVQHGNREPKPISRHYK